jgi:hypothetical protein
VAKRKGGKIGVDKALEGLARHRGDEAIDRVRNEIEMFFGDMGKRLDVLVCQSTPSDRMLT